MHGIHEHFESRSQFIQFLQEQANEIQRYKWIESEKVGYDLGQKAEIDWIKKYAAVFRDSWMKKLKNNTSINT